MSTEIITGALAAIGTVTSAFLTWMVARERTKRVIAEREMDFQAAAMEFAEYVDEWESTRDGFTYLIEHTNVDRILILRAWNGAMRPRWTTSIFQFRTGDQEPITYQHYELDADYVDRLKAISAGRPMVFRTADIPDCGIKAIYQTEGVVESMWAHIGSRQLRDSSSRAITYASFSTMNDEGLSLEDQTHCRILLGRLKGIYMGITPDAITD